MEQHMAEWCRDAGLSVERVATLEAAIAALPGPPCVLLLQVVHSEARPRHLFIEPTGAVPGSKGEGLTHLHYSVPARGPSSLATLLHGYADALLAYAESVPYARRTRTAGAADVDAVRERAAAILALAEQW